MREDIVIIHPGKEQEFVEEAKRLGWTGLLILYEENDAKKILQSSENTLQVDGMVVKTGVLLASQKVPVWTERFSEVAVLGTMISQIPKGVTLLCDNEYEKEKDYTHQRRSGVSHVTLAECRQKGVRLVAGISRLQDSSQGRQSQVFGRMKQNKKLARKKNVEYHVVSLAREPKRMRSRVDVRALERSL
ncbi:MAG: hypothetical protein ACOCU6_00430 [Nanoarchaeota archaeon]